MKTNQQRRFVPRLEVLEDKSLPSTFRVTTTLDIVGAPEGKISLREAITRANQHAGTDTIVLRPGVYNLTLPGVNEDGNTTGDLDIRDVLIIEGAGAVNTIIDGQQLDRIFDVRGASAHEFPVMFQKLTIRNGFTNSNAGGGGVLVANADLVFKDSIITGNRTATFSSGGGVSNFVADTASDVTLIRSIVSHNSAGGRGGGVVLDRLTGQASGGRLTVIGSTIRQNVSRDSGGGFDVNTADVTNSSITGNSAEFDGGGFSAEFATVTNSTVSGNRSGGSGGGFDAFEVSLARCTVAGNRAYAGGGIYVTGDTTLTKSTIRDNFAVNEGGGIRASDNLTLDRSTVAHNAAATGAGGGIYLQAFAEVTLIGSAVRGNVAADSGGGLHVMDVTLTRSTIADNTVMDGIGGGVFALRNVTVDGSTVSGNSATSGGGIYARDNGFGNTNTILVNSTLSGNKASDTGGGLYASSMALVNVSITENWAHTSGGGVFQSANGFVLATVRNTIIAQNHLDQFGGFQDISGVFHTQGNNLIGDGSGAFPGFTDGQFGDQVGTFANPKDARLGPLAFNGGPTMTHKPTAGSPAVDGGRNEADLLTGPLPAFDQRGRARFKDGDGRGGRIVDIGAVER